MTREETALIVKTLRLAYPGFYSKYKPGDFTDLVALWATMFADENALIVTEAVKQLIKTHTGFPPEIADVNAKIEEMARAATGEPTNEEYWTILRRALADGTWGAQKQFDALPEPLKQYCGSPSWLRDHATMDTDVVDSVIHGQFLKQFPAVKKAQEYRESMSPALREAITRLYKPIDGGDYKPLNEPDFNTARNNVLNALAGA